MGEPRQGIVFRGMKTGDYVSAWIHPIELHVRQFEWKDLVCFMGGDDAAEYCTVAPCPYSLGDGTGPQAVQREITSRC